MENMKDFLKQDICIEDSRIDMDEPMTMEEYAALAQLLGKFRKKCGSMGDLMQVSSVLAMVTHTAVEEVEKYV